MCDDPTPHAPPYLLPVEREPIPIHEGELELCSDSETLRGFGRLELAVAPRLRFKFALENVVVRPNVFAPSRLSVDGLTGDVQAWVNNASLGPSGRVIGSVEGALGDCDDPSIQVVRFFVANLPKFWGEPLHERFPGSDEGSQDMYWRGRLSLMADGWTIDLDMRRDHKAVYGRLEEQGGNEITHLGCLRRVEGACFRGDEATGLLDALSGFLGFVSGAWATPLAAVGIDRNGIAIWREFKTRWTSSSPAALNAFDRSKHDLTAAFEGYLRRWHNELWNEPLRIASQLYVEANSPVTVETSLVLSQTVLELIAWMRFVEELKIRAAGDFDGLRASDRIRELLAWLHVDPAIPPQLTSLAQEATRWGWADGPHAIGEVRNALIHPPKRAHMTQTSVLARVELQELALWYVEVALLRLIDFNGSYFNRLGERYTGVVEPVPWALS